ncbi:MAG: group III truncated hemoglobin [Phycisphaerales bacterium]|nr:group III truncated hemoglobin [Phycisphaerales bacterium]
MSTKNPHVRLPLTAVEHEPAPRASASLTPAVIARVVDEFYAACRVDPVLGPVFNARVDSWDAHLARIRSLWGAALLGERGYAGRPLEAHLAIEGLSAEHFSAWLRLFKQTVERVCTAQDAAAFMARAGRMARAMRRE